MPKRTADQPSSPESVHVWVSLGAPDDPPQRLAVTVCPQCTALVADQAEHLAAAHREVNRR